MPALIIAAAAAATIAPQNGTPFAPHQVLPPPASWPQTAASTGPAARTLLTNVPGAPSSFVPGLVVPGAGAVPLQPGIGDDHIDRVYAHPGGHWAVTAFADLGTSEDECLIVDGQLVIREGTPAPWVAGEDCGTIDQRVSVNGAGDVVLATNTSGSSNDDWIAARVGGAWTVFAREGDPVPGLPGATLDDRIDSPVLLDDGRALFAADGIDGVPSTAVDDVIVLGAGLLMQEGVSVPAGQAGGATRAIENFDLGDLWAAADGSSWLVQGDLEGSTSSDDVVVVDGAVVLQEGSVIPGSGFAEPIDSSGIFGVSMAADGTWFARGDNDGTNDDWVVRNGAVIAATGAPILPGATERWDDGRFSEGFFGHAGNAVGDHVIGGCTDHADPALDAVLVLSGVGVVARESDPVDLDGDGLFDDDVFIDAFGDDDLALTDDRRVLAVVALKDPFGVRVGQALLELDAGGGAIGDVYCDAAPNSTGEIGALAASGSDVAAQNALRLDCSGLPPRSFAVLLAGRGRVNAPGFAGGVGRLCVLGPVAAYRTPSLVMTVGPAGTATIQPDLTAVPWPNATAPVIAGDTLCFQVFHRDVTASGAQTSNLTTALEVTFR